MLATTGCVLFNTPAPKAENVEANTTTAAVVEPTPEVPEEAASPPVPEVPATPDAPPQPLAEVAQTEEPAPSSSILPGTPVERYADEIVVAGQRFRTGTPVVLWTDPGGFDGYRVERRFSPWERAEWRESKEDAPTLDTPNRYGARAAVLTPEQLERVRGGGWPLELLQDVVDQFVLHYDVAGTSKRCFERLHDQRGLSIHFLLDVDGTIYQTIDLKERAWHATKANSRSIGIEIANIGAYPDAMAKPLREWYKTDSEGRTFLTIPENAYPESVRTAEFVGRPIRDEHVCGMIHGEEFHQYDLTAEQYDALIKLTATLCRIFPKMACDYPRDKNGELLTTSLDDADWKEFQGIIGHYHIQRNKIDPGPALQWDRIVDGARELLRRWDGVMDAER